MSNFLNTFKFLSMLGSIDKKIKTLLLISVIVFILNTIIMVGYMVLTYIYFPDKNNMTDNQMNQLGKSLLQWSIWRLLLGLFILSCNVVILAFSIPIFWSVTRFKSLIVKILALIGISFWVLVPFSFAGIIYILILKSKYKKTIKYYNAENTAIVH